MHLTLFEVLLPIYKHVDLKVIKRTEKLREEKLSVKAFVAVLMVVLCEGLLLLTKILLFPPA